jgi:LAO/AO transport system kinase
LALSWRHRLYLLATDLLKKFHAGSALAAARMMSAVERGGPEAEALLDEIFPKTGRAWRIGITGGTGSGKSTLVDGVTAALRDTERTVGVVAEDPTSPFTGGAILGDRIRMRRAAGDPGVFVRSVASRGSETGFSDLAVELADVLDAFGRDVVLMETIGVGQLEHRIRFAADTTVVVFTPEAGDEVQSLKSGLMEVGDIFVVNKGDRPGADRFARDIFSTLELRHEGEPWPPVVVQMVATEGKGLATLMGALERHREFLAADGRLEARRSAGREARVRSLVAARLEGVFWGKPYIKRQFSGIFEEVAAGRLSPYAAAARLVAAYEEQ